MKIFLPFLLILLSGCTTIPKYNYQSQASTDPSFIFGDRFGGGSVHGAARTFAINTKDAVTNNCADFAMVGATSNNWIKISPPTIEIKTPPDRAVSIRGTYLYGTTSCLPPVLMFVPKAGERYSVDVGTTYDKCYLSIVQKLPNGQQEKVDGISVLPACKEQ